MNKYLQILVIYGSLALSISLFAYSAQYGIIGLLLAIIIIVAVRMIGSYKMMWSVICQVADQLPAAKDVATGRTKIIWGKKNARRKKISNGKRTNKA